MPIEPGDWVVIPDQYHFSVKFVFDRLVGAVGDPLVRAVGHDRRVRQPLHAPRAGYNRFFVLYALFVLGMVVTSLAGTIETLFAGWELVGLSSALLVAFFQERPAPARNGLWVWVDLPGLRRGAAAGGRGDAPPPRRGRLRQAAGHGPLAGDQSRRSRRARRWSSGLLLLVAAAGKSALVPFSGWLPRAMEGPTPSSAVFYGALSVHLGAFLLLRVSPLLDASPTLSALVVALGLDDGAVRLSRGQRADRHQVGPVVRVAVAGGDHRRRDRPGVPVRRPGSHPRPRLPADAPVRAGADAAARLPHARERDRRAPAPRVGCRGRRSSHRVRDWLYRFALERGYLDALLRDYVVGSRSSGSFRWCDALERRWTDFLAGEASRESDEVKPHFGTIEELLMTFLELPWLELAIADRR